jgi:hypothetical protein
MHIHSTNDEHNDAFRQALARSGALDPRKPTTDLVAGALSRLPHTPPRVAARRAALRQALGRAATVAVVALLVIPAAVGAFNLMRGAETPIGAFASTAGQSQMRAAILAAIGQRLDMSLVRALVGALMWLVQVMAVVLTLGFWPRRSAAAGMTLLAMPFRTFGTGLLSIGLLIAGVAALLTLLTATLAGLPIAAIVCHPGASTGCARHRGQAHARLVFAWRATVTHHTTSTGIRSWQRRSWRSLPRW